MSEKNKKIIKIIVDSVLSVLSAVLIYILVFVSLISLSLVSRGLYDLYGDEIKDMIYDEIGDDFLDHKESNKKRVSQNIMNSDLMDINFNSTRMGEFSYFEIEIEYDDGYDLKYDYIDLIDYYDSDYGFWIDYSEIFSYAYNPDVDYTIYNLNVGFRYDVFDNQNLISIIGNPENFLLQFKPTLSGSLLGLPISHVDLNLFGVEFYYGDLTSYLYLFNSVYDVLYFELVDNLTAIQMSFQISMIVPTSILLNPIDDYLELQFSMYNNVFNLSSYNESTYESGYDNGYDNGYEDGLNDNDGAYQNGYNQGYSDGVENAINPLIGFNDTKITSAYYTDLNDVYVVDSNDLNPINGYTYNLNTYVSDVKSERLSNGGANEDGNSFILINDFSPFLDNTITLSSIGFYQIEYIYNDNSKGYVTISDERSFTDNIINNNKLVKEILLRFNSNLNISQYQLDIYVVNNYQNGYQNGYNQGFSNGKNDVLNNPDNYDLYNQNQLDEAKDLSYSQGYNKGVLEGEGLGERGFLIMFNAILNAPYNIFNGLLNFELFGVNLFNLITFIITTGLIIFLFALFKSRK